MIPHFGDSVSENPANPASLDKRISPACRQAATVNTLLVGLVVKQKKRTGFFTQTDRFGRPGGPKAFGRGRKPPVGSPLEEEP